MKVGDLVRIKYDGVVALITKVEIDSVDPDGNNGRYFHGNNGRYFHLLGQPVPFRADRIEEISETR